MSAKIISNIASLGFDYEPDIMSDNGRDGISLFQFSIVGSLANLRTNFALDQVVSGVPDQPPGSFRVVRRNLSHIVGNPSDGLYRLQISAEGGTGDPNMFILESSYQYQRETTSGTYFDSVLGGSASIQYSLEWLSPTVTITTNSQKQDATEAQNRARNAVFSMPVQVVKDKPLTGPNGNPLVGVAIDQAKIIITGSSIEKAGGLYRVRASATKGQVQQLF